MKRPATADGLTLRSPRPQRSPRPHALVLVIVVLFVICVAERGPSAGAAQAPAGTSPTQSPKGPVFRAGAHLVTVDAYPTQGGKIIPDLKPEDFEDCEDGKPQQVE